jgi:hypothetical protein
MEQNQDCNIEVEQKQEAVTLKSWTTPVIEVMQMSETENVIINSGNDGFVGSNS